MTATQHNPPQPDVVDPAPLVAVAAHVERMCRTAIAGRRATRALADWAKPFALVEAELQLLWCLRPPHGAELDQRTLAGNLAFSAAQVSVLVERLRAQGLVCQRTAAGDRRRNLWRLSSRGRELLEQMLRVPAAAGAPEAGDVGAPREDAA